jgi:hypothetical protein
MNITLCHPSCAKAFEVDPRFLDDLCTPDQNQHISLKKILALCIVACFCITALLLAVTGYT